MESPYSKYDNENIDENDYYTIDNGITKLEKNYNNLQNAIKNIDELKEYETYKTEIIKLYKYLFFGEDKEFKKNLFLYGIWYKKMYNK